jgi:hypothetical protein
VKKAGFGYGMAYIREDFYRIERDREYVTPPLIPWQHQNLNDPRTISNEMHGLRQKA